jgi:hypothetical protein
MSGEYRDDLSAAHARIAELEEKVRALEEEAGKPAVVADGRFPELEAEVARLRGPADPLKNAQLRTRLTWISIVFPLLGMTFSFLHLPIFATFMSSLFLIAIVTNQVIARRLPTAKARLNAAEAKLTDARRIAELEQKLAETRVRIAAPAPPIQQEEEVSDAEAEEPRRARA